MNIICNNCLDEFEIEKKSILRKTIEGLEIQYFVCPSCGYPYVILVEDEEMKKLTAAIREINKKLQAGKIGHFRAAVIRKLLNERDGIMRQVKADSEDLKRQAERMLKEDFD